jgi:methionyl-tRNA synthetase
VPVPLPGWDDRRLYVWFDAVIGYLSASVEWAGLHGDPEAWRRWWQGPAARHRYFVGKDNIWFHTVWWPAILLGAGDGLRPPDEVVANHHLVSADGKLSASRGSAPTIDEAIDRFGLDPLRHALCALSPETADVELAWDKLEELTTSGLLGAIAGPPHRVATLLWRRFGGRPDPAALSAAEPERAQAAAALAETGAALDRGELRRALASVHGLGRTVNRRLAATEPWRLPDPDAHRELTRLLPLLDALGVAAWPFVPGTAGRVRALLGRPPAPIRWALDPEPPLVPAPPAPPLPPAQARSGSQ